MEQLDTNELWRRIPPEEKFELMARAQSKGVVAALIGILILSTIAVGLTIPPLLWIALLCSPFVFQYAAGKAWRGIRPRIMLEYLAARSAARRYAFSIQGRELGNIYIFRGYLTRLFDSAQKQEELEGAFERKNSKEVWIALFPDSFVAMSEGMVGAELEFACLLDDRLRIEGRSPQGASEYSDEREVVMKVKEKKTGQELTYSITSRFSAALVVFERKIIQSKENVTRIKEKESNPVPIEGFIEALDAEQEDDSLFGSGGLIGL